MDRITVFALRRRRAVALAWLVLTIAGGWAASGLGNALSQSFDAPGRPAFEANRQIVRASGSGGVISPIVAVRDGTGPAARVDLRRVADAVPGARAVVGGPALTAGGVTAALVFPPPGRPAPDSNDGALAAARHAAAGHGVTVTGEQALSAGSGGGGAGLLVETLLGGLGALVVLAIVFASPLAGVPIVLAVASILTTFLIVRGIAAGFQISFVVQFLAGLIGLGVAIDYSLLIIVRWREELAAGRGPDAAVEAAMSTAGRAVVASGLTVAIGLLALIAVPVPFIRSIGVGGLLIPLVSVAATLTLLPGILATVGVRLDRRHRGHPERPGRVWSGWSRTVVRHRVAGAIAGLAVMVALALAATSLHPGDPAAGSLASSGAAHSGLVALQRAGLGSGTLTPIEVLAPSDRAAALRSRLGGIDGVRAVLAPVGRGWASGDRRLLVVLPRADGASSSGRRAVDGVRALHSDSVLVGGVQAANADLTDAIYGAFPLMLALIAVLTFALLARALRSVVLPLKAIALNIVSVAAAFGVVVLVWQQGHGSELIGGLPGTGAITNWVPLAIFAFLYGLSMDYEVFILSRMREEYDRTGSTDEAVVGGLSRTGRLVTSAALILLLAFVALGAGPETQLKILATGLAAGIALDATVVRALIVPALVSLLGRANWWAPRWLRGSAVEPARPAVEPARPR